MCLNHCKPKHAFETTKLGYAPKLSNFLIGAIALRVPLAGDAQQSGRDSSSMGPEVPFIGKVVYINDFYICANCINKGEGREN